MTKLVARKNLNLTKQQDRLANHNRCACLLCLSCGLLTACNVPNLNSSVDTVTLACVAASFLVCFSVCSRDTRA